MNRGRTHVHLLNPQNICCPEHLYEMAVVLFNQVVTKQRRYDDLLALISNMLEVLDTRFLLDTSKFAVMVKKTLGAVINKTAVHSLSLGDSTSALSALEVAEAVLGSTPDSEDCLSYLSSTYTNLGYCLTLCATNSTQDFDRAIDYVDRALAIDRKRSDPIGNALGKLAKAAILSEVGAYQEAFSQAKEAAKHLEPLLEEFLKTNEDAELLNNTKFINILELQISAFAREISALNFLHTKSSSAQAEELLSHAFRLSQRFLPEDHELISKLSASIGLARRSPLKIRTSKQKLTELSASMTILKDDDDSINSRVKGEELSNLEETSFTRPSEKTTFSHAKSRASAPVSVKGQSKKRFFPKSPSPETIPDLTPPKVVRLPDDPGPRIPFRSLKFRSCFRFDMTKGWERSDHTFLLNQKQKYVIMPDGMQVTQILVCYGEAYKVTCGVAVKSNIPYLMITGENAKSATSFVTPESIQISDLEGIINLLSFKDVAPWTVHVKFINSFERFAQFFLFPFLRVTDVGDGQRGKKIELWGQAAGLLNKRVERVIFNTSCRIFLHSLSLRNLRLILCDSAKEDYGEQCLRVDVDYDKEAAGNVLSLQSTLEQEPGLLRKMIPSLAPVSVEFLTHLDRVITEIELMGKDQFGPDVTFESFLASSPFFMFRTAITEAKLNKTLWTLSENDKEKCWDVRAKALYTIEDSSRAIEVMHKVTYIELVSLFGVRLDLLELGERRLLAKIYLEGLHIFTPSPEDSGDQSPDPEISLAPVSVVLSRRYLLTKDSSKVPVTLSLLGIGDKLIGVKAVVYDIGISMESGCFFPLDLHNFAIPKTNSGVVNRPGEDEDSLYAFTESETNLKQLLDMNDGWKTIFNALQFKPEKTGLRMFITDRTGKMSVLDSLDNVLFRYK